MTERDIQNNSTIGSSPDPLSAREGLAGETTHEPQQGKRQLFTTNEVVL